jgi:hypothetical protein
MGPLTVDERLFEAEARQIIVTHTCWRFTESIRTIWQHSHTISTPSTSPPCSRTPLSLASIVWAQSKSTMAMGPTYGWWMDSWGEKVTLITQTWRRFAEGMRMFSQHSHTIATPSMPSPCSRAPLRLASIWASQAKSKGPLCWGIWIGWGGNKAKH